MSRLLSEKVRLKQKCIYLDPRISFNKIDRYFFSGASGAYFMIAVDCFTDLRYREVEFNTYGRFVDYGTGRNTPRGNPGDIGKANGRKRKRWFSHKYFASVMNIQEFYADSLGQEFCRAISNDLNPTSCAAESHYNISILYLFLYIASVIPLYS